MLTERRVKIFKAIVDEFIKTAEPVGSITLMKKYDLPYSSATIRNDMVVLEEMGFLEKTHTSSGRVPSTAGYRFYVEHLLENKLDDNLEMVLKQTFDASSMNMSEVIKHSCDVLAKMTNLASGALGPDASSQTLEHVKLFPINERSAVAIFITNTGYTENRVFSFETDCTVEDIENCCTILNDRLKGTPIRDVVEKMNQIRPILENAVVHHEMLFRAFVQAFVKFASDNVYFSGQNKMLYQPEFADIEKLKAFMNLLENHSVWRDFQNNKNETSIKVGNKGELMWIDDMAVVTSKFTISQGEEGKLMVVGPSRMNYDKVVSILDYMSEAIENLYKKGGSQ